MVSSTSTALLIKGNVKEIIIVNNGKENLDCLKNINNEVSIKVLNAVQNCGASQARNIGATFATGEYLAFLDDDDLWLPNYLGEFLRLIESSAHREVCITKIC